MIYASLTLLIYKEKRNQAKFHAFILHYAHLILSLHRENTSMEIHFAPLQGYTDFEYRRIHARHCGGVQTYYSPFIRWEKGGIRDKDIKDILPENNEGLHLIPQIICSDTDEFNRLADAVQEHGYEEMDLNMGCPAPMQTKLMRGSGILPHPMRLQALLREMERRPEVRFSAKMRLGLESKEEWRELSDMLNSSCLQHLTIHPRIGKQMYKGEVDMETFHKVYDALRIPIIYNGDITEEQFEAYNKRLDNLDPKSSWHNDGQGPPGTPHPGTGMHTRQGDAHPRTHGHTDADAPGHARLLHTQVQGGLADTAAHTRLLGVSGRST